MERVGLYLGYPGREQNPNDFPYYFAYCAGLECLYEWAEQGRKPPSADPIPYDEYPGPMSNAGKEKGESRLGQEFPGAVLHINRTDESGNAIGGWRLPEIDAPVCVYKPNCTPLKPGADVRLFGCELPYSPQKLHEMYHDLENYCEKVRALAREAVKKRFLLEEDLEECVAHAAAKARKYGLRSGKG